MTIFKSAGLFAPKLIGLSRAGVCRASGPQTACLRATSINAPGLRIDQCDIEREGHCLRGAGKRGSEARDTNPDFYAHRSDNIVHSPGDSTYHLHHGGQGQDGQVPDGDPTGQWLLMCTYFFRSIVFVCVCLYPVFHTAHARDAGLCCPFPWSSTFEVDLSSC